MMDGFPKFPRIFRGEEWKPLEIKSEQLEAIVSRLLSEFNLDFRELKRIENDDMLAIATNKLGEETKSLVRVRSYTIGLDEEDVEDLYEDMLMKEATSAIFITSSHFTKGAKKFAKHVPIRLVDGVELGKLLSEYEKPKAEFAFLSRLSDGEVVRYFRSRGKRKFFWISPTGKIEEIDKRYIPLGHFSMKKIRGGVETVANLYVDLNSGNVLYMEENRIEENNFIKKILDLPEESRAHLLDLMEHGELDYEHLKGKPLNILEKKGLIGIHEGDRGEGILDILTDEITSTVSIATSELTSTTHKAPTPGERAVVKTKQVRTTIEKPTIDTSFDLGHFIESAEVDPSFTPDPINYSPEDVLNILKRVYGGNEVSFLGMIYLPYYRCKYVSDTGVTRFERLIAPKFKPFVPKPAMYRGIYSLIDRFPAIPYLVIGLGYLLLNLDKLEYVIHVFSSAFIFLLMAVVVGILLKVIFKTERKIPRYGGTIAKYGFPSIHTLASIGGIAFIYFVDPIFTLLLIPLGLLYMYSRIKIGVHSDVDVIGGAIVGIIIGIFCGIYVLNIYLDPAIETIFGALFFIAPLMLTVIELRMR